MIGDQERSQSVKNARFSTKNRYFGKLHDFFFIKLKDAILCGIKLSTNFLFKVKRMTGDREMSQSVKNCQQFFFWLFWPNLKGFLN